MISVCDLMQGNWVYDGERTQFPMYVQMIGDDYVYLNFEANEGDVWESAPEDLQGIEVTEEMLLKIGFEKCKDIAPRTFYRYWDKEHRYKLDADDAYCNSNRMWSIHIDNGDCNTIGSGEFTYVHELQNLVRVATGHNLPIEREVFDE